MGTIADTANSVWRDYEIVDDPTSDPHKPIKAEIRDLFGQAENYTAPDGTLPITISEKLDEIVSVTGWMTTPYDSAADHTSWLLNVIDKVHSQLGGAAVGILFPHPLYNISATLPIPHDGIRLIGRGCGTRRETQALTRASASTRIIFSATAPAAPMITFEPISGAAASVTGGGIQEIMLDGSTRATICLNLLSVRDMSFYRVHCFRATDTMLFMGCTSGIVTSGSDGYLCTNNYFHQVRCHASGAGGTPPTSYALQLTGGQGNGGLETGPNTAVNHFDSCYFVSNNQDAVILRNSDTNTFVGGIMSYDQGSHFGLRCVSGNNGPGIARYTDFLGVGIRDVFLESGQTGDLSPLGLCFINKRSNASGLFTVQAPAGGSDRAGYSVLDPFQVTAIGDGDYNISGWGIGSPANQSVTLMFHTGGRVPASATDGFDTVPSVTETYVVPIFVPCNMTTTGISILNGSAIAGNIRPYLYDSTRTIVRNGTNGAAAGPAGYQRITWTSPANIKGPATYWLAYQCNSVGMRFRSHIFGDFPAGKLTGTIYNTAPAAGWTAPTAFAANLGPIGMLY